MLRVVLTWLFQPFKKVLDIDIDYYALINMQGMIDLVDTVRWYWGNESFWFSISIAENEPEFQIVEPGTHKINSEQASLFVYVMMTDGIMVAKNVNMRLFKGCS